MAHTNEQTAIINHTEGTSLAEVARLLTFAKRCREAIVPLPHNNEAGESVVHGDNCDMERLASAYAYLAQTYYDKILTREQEIEIDKQFPDWRRWLI